jgi:peptidoglycan hydrolase-like protein with peptidoglycan-binding domain
MQISEEQGAAAVSFWSWQHADQQAWDAIQSSQWFRVPAAPETYTSGQVRAYQVLLSSLGFAVGMDGVWGPPTAAAVSAYQRAARLPVTGTVDAATRALMLTPFAPPIKPVAG